MGCPVLEIAFGLRFCNAGVALRVLRDIHDPYPFQRRGCMLGKLPFATGLFWKTLVIVTVLV